MIEILEGRSLLGFLSGATALYGRLTVRETIRFFGEAHGVGRAHRRPGRPVANRGRECRLIGALVLPSNAIVAAVRLTLSLFARTYK
ncbi:hypothetical protein [Paludibacterium paludis]|nr:hypothetical protein [Paludibacterium paludis]